MSTPDAMYPSLRCSDLILTNSRDMVLRPLSSNNTFTQKLNSIKSFPSFLTARKSDQSKDDKVAFESVSFVVWELVLIRSTGQCRVKRRLAPAAFPNVTVMSILILISLHCHQSSGATKFVVIVDDNHTLFTFQHLLDVFCSQVQPSTPSTPHARISHL